MTLKDLKPGYLFTYGPNTGDAKTEPATIYCRAPKHDRGGLAAFWVFRPAKGSPPTLPTTQHKNPLTIIYPIA